ncbi:UDP-N-acetyl-D-glucosamine 6-dehydrogenase [Candidatus Sulfobium mesophilum]|uniref:UDP-N-acetyl-D-glucosamine 6-dehydrogenase n=1 Tax=Candidatus Sulfobium mesophilum TaxID=2016548 RepID=A0A2U3QDP7_9BACT|nr:UDP-N-acetyl-D-glucosamine 6-dehydrogenase [Candidatus Sulfobium mesophilum]
MDLGKRIQSKEARVGIIGLGYVGLPLVIEFCKAGFNVTGFDVDPKKVAVLARGESYIEHIDAAHIRQCGTRFLATTDFSKLADIDCIVICVPTPLNKNREPNLAYVLDTTRTIARYLRKGQLVALESTTYPGTTDEDMKEILENGGLKAGKDFHLAFSPEREDPNNKDFSTSTIPKVVGGYTEQCLKVAKALYDSIVVSTVPVSSTKVAESTKLLENIYRAVNIALVNELKILFDRMGIDIWEVIDAAKTKPFGFQAFYPGPGLGGHCIPIDPFYLTWKAREYDFSTRFIELAGQINTDMPYYVVEKVGEVLNAKGKALKGSKVLVLGMAYKKDVDDQRESPALMIVELLLQTGAEVTYNDPHVPVCQGHRHYPEINMKSVGLTEDNLKEADLLILVTDHSAYDYAFIERHAGCIVDTRGAFRKNGIKSEKVYRA